MRKSLPLLTVLIITALACNAGDFFEAVTATPMPLPTLAATNLDPNYQPGGATAIPPTLTISPVPVESAFAPTNATAMPNLPGGTPPFALPEESLLILAPGPQSQVTSPITVTGISDPVFENTLFVQVLDENGAEIGSGHAIIKADLGQRGPFEGTVEFTPPGTRQVGTLVVSDSSARDGHLIHVSSVPITLLPVGGAADILGASEHPEDIAIQLPAPQQVISGGVVNVSGFSIPYFEQTLSVAVLDADGATVGGGVTTIQADVGQPGRFETYISYSVSSEQPGTIQVVAASPRDGSIIHLSSVGVTLLP